jgi:acetyl-CoA carboxylase carboxyl transferase subunit alpha
LWRSWDFKREAAAALKLTSSDMLNNKLIDGVIKEPLGGAHSNPQEMYATVKQTIIDTLAELKKTDINTLLERRIEKFCAMGVYQE